jgi:hypothetical protein
MGMTMAGATRNGMSHVLSRSGLLGR